MNRKFKSWLISRGQGVLEHFGLRIRRVEQLGTWWFLDVKKLSRGQLGTIFDVGANVGQSVEEFVKHFPGTRIYSFEPFSPAFDQLKRNVAHLPNVIPVNAALGNSCRSDRMLINRDSPTNSLLPVTGAAPEYVEPVRVLAVGTTEIKVLTLDGYCDVNSIQRIDLLKLDVQGYELQVVEGAGRLITEGRIPLIFAEVNFVPIYEGQSYFHELCSHLDSRGYQMVGLYNSVFHSEGFIQWGDALFMHPVACKAAFGSAPEKLSAQARKDVRCEK